MQKNVVSFQNLLQVLKQNMQQVNVTKLATNIPLVTTPSARFCAKRWDTDAQNLHHNEYKTSHKPSCIFVIQGQYKWSTKLVQVVTRLVSLSPCLPHTLNMTVNISLLLE